jgi:hypothetical protein
MQLAYQWEKPNHRAIFIVSGRVAMNSCADFPTSVGAIPPKAGAFSGCVTVTNDLAQLDDDSPRWPRDAMPDAERMRGKGPDDPQ